MESDEIKIGDKVSATVTRNGYFIDVYDGVVNGFTKNNRIKVKSWRGIKMHAKSNVKLIKSK
jgi:hypothetical protein